MVLNGIGLAARFGLAAVWFTSGIAKAASPLETKVAVRAYDLLPESVVGPVATVLPYLEIALGLLLVLGMVVRAAAIGSAVLLLVFIGGVISAAARGLSIDCGCFGGGGTVAPGQAQYWQEVARDIGFLALAAYLIVRPATPWSVDRLAATRTEPAETAP